MQGRSLRRLRARGLFKKAVQQGRSERKGDAYSLAYVEPLSEARTKLADFFNSPLMNVVWGRMSVQHGVNVLQAHQSHPHSRMHGGRAQMRKQHHLL